MYRGELWWADLREPRGSEPGYRRPVLIIQSDMFNRSGIATTIVAILTSNVELADAPGNLLLPAAATGLKRDSVVNVSQVVTLDRFYLTDYIGELPRRLLSQVDAGLRLILAI